MKRRIDHLEDSFDTLIDNNSSVKRSRTTPEPLLKQPQQQQQQICIRSKVQLPRDVVGVVLSFLPGEQQLIQASTTSRIWRRALCSLTVFNLFPRQWKCDLQRLASLMPSVTKLTISSRNVNARMLLQRSRPDPEKEVEVEEGCANSTATTNFSPVVDQINAFKNLKELELANNSVGNDGAECLANIASLTRLDVHMNRIGCNGAEHLGSKLVGLVELCISYISYNKLGDGGVRHLSNSQPHEARHKERGGRGCRGSPFAPIGQTEGTGHQHQRGLRRRCDAAS